MSWAVYLGNLKQCSRYSRREDCKHCICNSHHPVSLVWISRASEGTDLCQWPFCFSVSGQCRRWPLSLGTTWFPVPDPLRAGIPWWVHPLLGGLSVFSENVVVFRRLTFNRQDCLSGAETALVPRKVQNLLNMVKINKRRCVNPTTIEFCVCDLFFLHCRSSVKSTCNRPKIGDFESRAIFGFQHKEKISELYKDKSKYYFMN